MTENPDSRTKTTFVSNIADLSLSHLLELMMALGSYREGLVLVGGWVPYLLLKQHQNPAVSFQHVGSKDIDIAVNPAVIDEARYATLLELLQERGYRPKENNTFSFVKTVVTTQGEEQIQIDFLGPEYGGTPQNKRHQRVQDDFFLRKARGADVMFDHAIDITLEGKLPNGAEGRTDIRMANIVGIMTMKGIVLGSRYKEKDAYDLTNLVLHYKTGPFAVAEEIRPFKGHGLIKESIEQIHTKFRSREAEGPHAFADFYQAIGDAREQLKTQAYLQVQRFLTALYEEPKAPKVEVMPMQEDIPFMDIEPNLGGTGGPSGHFVHFQAINTGEKVAIDCHWGIRGFNYEWRSPEVFTLLPGEKRQLEYKISDEQPFKKFVPELNIFFEYKNNRGVSFFTRRELVLQKVPSDAFYNIAKVGQFHPAVVLKDSKIRNISEPFMLDNLITRVSVDVEVNGQAKQIEIGLSPILVTIFKFTPEELKAACAELVMRKVEQMLERGVVENYTFEPTELPSDRSLQGMEAYIALRDAIR